MGRSENINTLDLTIQVEESFTPMQIEDFVWIFREDSSREEEGLWKIQAAIQTCVNIQRRQGTETYSQ